MRCLALAALLSLALPALALAGEGERCTVVDTGGGVYSVYCYPVAGGSERQERCEAGERLGPSGVCLPELPLRPRSPAYDDAVLELLLEALRENPSR